MNQRDPKPIDPKTNPQRGDAPPPEKGGQGHGAAGAGMESARGAHPRGARPTTHDDAHPGSGWEDTGSGQAEPDPTQAPANTAGDDPRGQSTNRPGKNRQVTPRTAENAQSERGPDPASEASGGAAGR
jgi:hypothetical protein